MPDFRLTIDVKNVAGGDVDALADDILEAFGEEFDAAQGDFVIGVTQKHGSGYFARDPGDDDL